MLLAEVSVDLIRNCLKLFWSKHWKTRKESHSSVDVRKKKKSPDCLLVFGSRSVFWINTCKDFVHGFERCNHGWTMWCVQSNFKRSSLRKTLPPSSDARPTGKCGGSMLRCHVLSWQELSQLKDRDRPLCIDYTIVLTNIPGNFLMLACSTKSQFPILRYCFINGLLIQVTKEKKEVLVQNNVGLFWGNGSHLRSIYHWFKKIKLLPGFNELLLERITQHRKEVLISTTFPF